MFEWLKTICELIDFFGEAACWQRKKAGDGQFLIEVVIPGVRPAVVTKASPAPETETVELELYRHQQHGDVYVGLARKAKQLWYREAKMF
jgi:hypothetical protein